MMPAHAGKRVPVTVDEFLAREGEPQAELIMGSVVEKASPSAEHGAAQGGIDRRVGGRFARKPGGRWPGGWWFFTETELQLGLNVLRPDLCAYRRERMPAQPRGRPLVAVPEWVCEVLSPSTAKTDRVEKLQISFTAGVGHYWLIDPIEGSVEVFRRTDLAYLLVQSAHRGQRMRPEPFDAEEFSVDELLGDDPDDETP